ncbi:MAG: hypothetical protein DSZ05_04510 [Sulfurospirillum sp.]|nr:MAG: hypothetical protein DSZ05_04510 [Sulfurospirillum sp.]
MGAIVDKNFTSTIPFEWSGGLPIINVKIAGKTYKFLFDTAAPTTIPSALAKELQLKTVGKGRKLDRSLYKLPLLKVGDIGFKDYVVFVDDFKSKFPISCLGFDGIFGYNTMKDMKIKVDYQNQKITFSDKEIPHIEYIPVDIKFNYRYGPLVRLDFPFGNADFQIDTGKNANIQLGNPSVIPMMQKQGFSFREIRGIASSSIGGNNNHTQREYLAKDFSLDSKIKIKSFPIEVDNSGAFLIGNGFLKHFDLIIDFPAQKVYFKAIKQGVIDEGFNDTFGLTPFWDKNKGLFVSAITDKTPAKEANLKIGQKIISFNGKETSAMSQDDFCKLLLKYSNINKQKMLDISVKSNNGESKKIILKK